MEDPGAYLKDQAQECEGREVAQTIDRAVNSYSFETDRGFAKGFIDQIVNRTHRTLQQSIMRLVLGLLKAWAAKAEAGDGHYDLRNEATVKLAKKMLDAVKDETYLPFI